MRSRLFASLVFVVPLSLGLKYYRGSGEWWLNNWGASFGYEIFFALLATLFLPSPRFTSRICLTVCLATIGLEFLQLVDSPLLATARSTWPGKIVLGTTFSWWDIPAYPLGSLLAYGWLRSLAPRQNP